MKYLLKLSLIYFSSVNLAFSLDSDPSVMVGGVGYADTSSYPQKINTNLEDLAKLFKKFALFVGYNLDLEPPEANRQLLDLTTRSINLLFPSDQILEGTITNTLLPSIPVNAAVDAGSEKAVPMSFFVPLDSPYKDFNAYSNGTFTAAKYGTKQNSGSVSTSSLMDQSLVPASDDDTKGVYLGDPVSQSIFNILGTPNYSSCYKNNKNLLYGCKLLYDNLVMSNVIGAVPAPDKLYSYEFNQAVISQLNSNSLIAPLLLTTSEEGTEESEKPPLKATNQAQIAQNFIRYVTYATMPPVLPDERYDNEFLKATKKISDKNGADQEKQMKAQAAISKYLLSLRTYAAQTSVATGNLIFILSKRLPTTNSNNKSTVTSQALNEYTMASWRLFTASKSKEDPETTPNQQWINNLGKASPATVQVEIAQLLAEMNYQLYLNRQIQERILMTNNVILSQINMARIPVFNPPEDK